jgi:hypothetical protein
MATTVDRQPPHAEPAPQDSATSRTVQAPARAKRRISRSVTALQLQTIKAYPELHRAWYLS